MTLGALVLLTLISVGAGLQTSQIERGRAQSTPIHGDRPVNLVQVADQRGRALAPTRAVADRHAITAKAPAAEPATGRLELALVIAVLTMSAMVAFSTWWVVGRMLRPARAVRSRLDEIGDADLRLRVSELWDRDEIVFMAATANATLDRLEQSVSRQRQFASDAAHELRTPLAAMRVHLEEALMFPDADPHDALRDTLTGADRLEQILADLLLLTQLGACGAPCTERIDLTDLVTTEASRHSLVPIRTDLEPGLTVSGVPTELSRLVANLLDNAERYAETAVDISLCRQKDQIVLAVSDDGPGVPLHERDRVFERFARLDTARSREAGGFGLGLTIARDIAALHHGTLVIEDSPQGACFVLRLPSAGENPSQSAAAPRSARDDPSAAVRTAYASRAGRDLARGAETEIAATAAPSAAIQPAPSAAC